MNFKSSLEILEYCRENNARISDAVLIYEETENNRAPEATIRTMTDYWTFMKRSIDMAFQPGEPVHGSIIGGEARKIKEYREKNGPICGDTISRAIQYALAVLEVNASMGKIVAAPTAGSSGVLPAVFRTIQEDRGVSDEEITRALLNASGIGIIIAKNASLSGAQGGCQAEVGSAAAMAAAGVVEICGGTPEQCFHAAAIALKNCMGLVCDPVAGLVEVPCAKRNTMGAANALIAAEMAMAGVISYIPFDEVVYAMNQVGRMMSVALKETAEGGIAVSPTGICYRKKIFGQ